LQRLRRCRRKGGQSRQCLAAGAEDPASVAEALGQPQRPRRHVVLRSPRLPGRDECLPERPQQVADAGLVRLQGPAFIKVGTCVLYPARVCLNGNEWLKQKLRKEAIPFDTLDNGFQWCADPDRLQQLANSLSPAAVIREVAPDQAHSTGLELTSNSAPYLRTCRARLPKVS
jgi:hypothetical protein